MALSPMMQQYMEIKQRHENHILFYRLGDFYEMFFEDAKIASRELSLVLTGRDCGLPERAPMCGIPYHSSEGYIARLLKKGYKVAICEQTENPADVKGIVRREVVRVVTPGTVIENSLLEEDANNYIVSIYVRELEAGLCFCDISTGASYAIQLRGTTADELSAAMINELSHYTPSEALFNEKLLDFPTVLSYFKDRLSISVNLVEEEQYSGPEAADRLEMQFGEEGAAKIREKNRPLAEMAVGELLRYLSETQMTGLERITEIRFYDDERFMNLSLIAKRNLEITETMQSRERRGSLLWVLDKTKTAMGKRMLRSFLEQPLTGVAKISRRLGAVTELYENGMMRTALIEELMSVHDIERILTRILYGSANPREYKSLEYTTARLPQIRQILQDCKSELLSGLFRDLDPLQDITGRVRAAVSEKAPVSVKDGGVINDGYNAELDELRSIVADAKSFIAGIESSEREKTGIRNLKIGYNRIFGYYIEVTKSFQEQVPEHYIRRQTLANCERYVTEKLKELEAKVLSAGDKALRMEQQLFEELRAFISGQLARIQAMADLLAQLDVFCSLAAVALENRYCCPDVDLSDKLVIRDGRHPVVEKMQGSSPFVANDTMLDCGENQIAVITGPNMAGKSTYMRQTALIVLMAQIGSYVPASYARIGVADGIFTRVGASDDLTSGQSTFMMEMSEVADILRHCTKKSLLVLDEIGRGTSTFDGMSIARAVIEHIADSKKCGAKTLFATHYHQLTELERDFTNIKNFNIAVKKRGDSIVFLRRIVPGGVDDSYGIEVSKLAGVPNSITRRAYEILEQLESNQPIGMKGSVRREAPDPAGQMSMLGIDSEVENRLANVDVNTLTPIEALNLLYELKDLAHPS